MATGMIQKRSVQDLTISNLSGTDISDVDLMTGLSLHSYSHALLYRYGCLEGQEPRLLLVRGTKLFESPAEIKAFFGCYWSPMFRQNRYLLQPFTLLKMRKNELPYYKGVFGCIVKLGQGGTQKQRDDFLHDVRQSHDRIVLELGNEATDDEVLGRLLTRWNPRYRDGTKWVEVEDPDHFNASVFRTLRNAPLAYNTEDGTPTLNIAAEKASWAKDGSKLTTPKQFVPPGAGPQAGTSQKQLGMGRSIPSLEDPAAKKKNEKSEEKDKLKAKEKEAKAKEKEEKARMKAEERALRKEQEREEKAKERSAKAEEKRLKKANRKRKSEDLPSSPPSTARKVRKPEDELSSQLSTPMKKLIPDDDNEQSDNDDAYNARHFPDRSPSPYKGEASKHKGQSDGSGNKDSPPKGRSGVATSKGPQGVAQEKGDWDCMGIERLTGRKDLSLEDVNRVIDHQSSILEQVQRHIVNLEKEVNGMRGEQAQGVKLLQDILGKLDTSAVIQGSTNALSLPDAMKKLARELPWESHADIKTFFKEGKPEDIQVKIAAVKATVQSLVYVQSLKNKHDPYRAYSTLLCDTFLAESLMHVSTWDYQGKGTVRTMVPDVLTNVVESMSCKIVKDKDGAVLPTNIASGLAAAVTRKYRANQKSIERQWKKDNPVLHQEKLAKAKAEKAAKQKEKKKEKPEGDSDLHSDSSAASTPAMTPKKKSNPKAHHSRQKYVSEDSSSEEEEEEADEEGKKKGRKEKSDSSDSSEGH